MVYWKVVAGGLNNGHIGGGDLLVTKCVGVWQIQLWHCQNPLARGIFKMSFIMYFLLIMSKNRGKIMTIRLQNISFFQCINFRIEEQ